MRILILNWRDIKNPKSGGAEILTHEMAKRWVEMGHHVTQLCSLYAGGLKEEVVDGVWMIRRGSLITVYIWAFFLYFRQFRGWFDVVVDEVHGSPFFTPLYVKEKKVVLVCEVAKEIWFYMWPFPISILGLTLESIYCFFYKRVPFLTISQSTREDLIKKGIKSENITVLPMGFSYPPQIAGSKFQKEKESTIIFVGRLAKMKGIDQAISAFSHLVKRIPSAKLWIVGKGEENYVNTLKSQVVKQALQDHVTFYGFVNEEEKFSLMGRAHVIVVPSVREGWGLIVPEAGLVKTPAVVYNTVGLKDVVQHQKTGLITAKNTPLELAGQIERLLSDQKLYQALSQGARQNAVAMDWSKTAAQALTVIDRL